MNIHSHKIADLLPHTPPMVLIDEIIDWQETSAVTAVNITENSLFYKEGYGVPAHVGLEYMAQACGVYSGWYLLSNKLPICMGFLLSTRSYRSDIEWFKLGDRLIINISEVLRQQSMGVFDCRISCYGQQVALAQLTVYQSEEPAK